MSSATGPSWSDIAAWSTSSVAAGSGPHEQLSASPLRLVPELPGQIVLDLRVRAGPGDSSARRGRGAQVIGIDASGEMIWLARQHSAPASNASYLVDDAQQRPPRSARPPSTAPLASSG